MSNIGLIKIFWAKLYIVTIHFCTEYGKVLVQRDSSDSVYITEDNPNIMGANTVSLPIFLGQA